MGGNCNNSKSAGKGKGKKEGGNHHHSYTSKRPVGGKGIFVTCVRGKESRAVGEMYDLLEDIADQIYPKERVEEMQRVREEQSKEKARQRLEEEEKNKGGGDGIAKDSMDQDSTTTTTIEPEPTPIVEDSDDDDDDDDDDIEASIAKELAALKSSRGGSQIKVKRDGQEKGKGKGKERPRFQSIETGTECLCFIATAWPYDPVELTEAIVTQVQETGQSRTRYVQRLSPTTITCHSSSLDVIESQSARLIELTFANWAKENGKTHITYQIEPSLRSHTAPLSRSLLLPLLGSLCTRLTSPPTLSSPIPSRPLLTVSANLKNPDLVLLPSVLKNCYGLSVVRGDLWKGKKFNLEQIAMEVRRKRGVEEDSEMEQGESKEKKVKVEESGGEQVGKKVELVEEKGEEGIQEENVTAESNKAETAVEV